MKKLLLIGFLFTAISGCSTTSGLDAKTSTSGFDGKKSVTIMPHSASCATMICPAIGATWIEDKPDLVGLNFEVVNDLRTISAAELNIDGDIIRLTNRELTNLNTNQGLSSSKLYVTDYKIINKILDSNRTWVRLSTSKGYVEAPIIDSGKDSKAFHALKRFKQQVDSAK